MYAVKENRQQVFGLINVPGPDGELLMGVSGNNKTMHNSV